MSESFNEPEVPVSSYGAARKADWLAGLQARADDMTQAAMQAHQQDHDRVTSGQGGIFGAGVTGQQQAASVAERPARVGDASGNGRDLVALGGSDLVAHGATGPTPARVDLTRIGQPVQPPGEMMSPLVRHQRGL